MNQLSRFLPLSFALLSGFAIAGGSGTLYDHGKKIALPNAYAYRGADPFDKDKQITVVVFADKPIDAKALLNARDRGDALDDQMRKLEATRLSLNVEADGSVQNVNINGPEGSASQSGSGWYTLTLKQNDAKRIEGSFVSTDEADKKDGRFYDLTFTLDLPGEADLGAALPADGGEPGKAYLAYLAALKKGDIDALAKTMSKERSAELLSHRSDADFQMMFGFIQGQALRDAKYSKGNIDGDTATLEYLGKDGDGNATTSAVTMIKQDGAWRLQKESTSTHVE